MLVIEVDGPAAGLDRAAAADRRDLPAIRRAGEVLQAATAERAGAALEVPQDGRRRRRPAEPELHDPGRRGAADPAAAHHAPDRRDRPRSTSVRIVNVAHAGDGNVHPILLFDERDRDEVERALAAGREMLEECIACGGSVTAEHGIGVEKLALMDRQFAPADLEAMRRVRRGVRSRRPVSIRENCRQTGAETTRTRRRESG